LAILVGGLVALATAAQDSRNYAVAELRASGVPESDAAIITERLRSELLTLGKVRVMERSEMALVLQEQSFQQSGVCDQSSCALEIGKILSVDRMVVGSVGRIGSLFTLSVRVLSVETGEIVQSFNVDHRGDIEDIVLVVVPKIAQKLSGIEVEYPVIFMNDANQYEGDIYVTTSISGANVVVEGVSSGPSPLSLENVQAGTYKVRATKGDLYADTVLKVNARGLSKVHLTLSQGYGYLKIVSEPLGAHAWVDGAAVGTTPLVLDSVNAGEHSLELELNGYLPISEQVTVKAAEQSVQRIRFVPGAKISFRANYEAKAVLVDVKGVRLGVDLDAMPVWVPAGDYRIEVEDDLFEAFSARFNVRKGENGFINVRLEPRKGLLKLTSKPGAEIWNGVGVVGKTPWESPWLDTGSYTYTLKAKNYRDTTINLLLGKGERQVWNVKMKPTEEWSARQSNYTALRWGIRALTVGCGTFFAVQAIDRHSTAHHAYERYDYWAWGDPRDKAMGDENFREALLWDAAGALMLTGFTLTWFF